MLSTVIFTMAIIIIVVGGILAIGIGSFFVIIQAYQQGVVFRFGKIVSVRKPGLNLIIPFVDVVHKVDLRVITLPVPKQKIITKDNVSVDISAVAYYKIINPIKSILGVQNVAAAIDQIAQTSLRNIVGKFQLDEILSERETINAEITKILDGYTEGWGVVVSTVEIKDIELPEDMQSVITKWRGYAVSMGLEED